MDETDGPEGGDPACWLARVCADCGSFREELSLDHCQNCGAPLGDEERD
ncbi:hypothetical protein NGB36_26880 [Streptomyces sp. RB6PN25]|uniref:Small CPxCG-related zinc finger protein n=1 Tax=Streptomyces humicola TaxID=2953240 RepID=A0ABT1Q431_9ACTN|nr:hypothetical protein [Streptomyces humicola]MCQ4084100.1 hypothetical protein [Streptomyces humicola]